MMLKQQDKNIMNFEKKKKPNLISKYLQLNIWSNKIIVTSKSTAISFCFLNSLHILFNCASVFTNFSGVSSKGQGDLKRKKNIQLQNGKILQIIELS